LCLLFGLLPGISRAEQTQDAPVADAQEAETPQDAVPATQTPTETLEAETVSLSKDEVRVIKGKTTTLTAEIPEAQRGESPLTTSPAIVWTSSNPTVATVDSNGVVTGVEIGEATITATLNGSVIETFTVYSTFDNGYYVFATLDYSQYLCADELSMGNSVGMYSLPSWHLNSDEAGIAENIGRKWYLYYHGGGYYFIYPAYSTDMALCLFDTDTPKIRPIGTTTDYSNQWKITSGAFYYVIQNRENSNVYLSFSESEDFSPVVGVTSSSPTSGVQNWCIDSAFDDTGLLLFDKLTGDLVANSWDNPTSEHIAYLDKSRPQTLGHIGMYVEVMVPVGQSASYNMSFSSSAFSYSTSTCRISATASTSTTATISKTVSGTQHAVSFVISAYSSTNVISVLYDNAYIYRYSDAYSRISQITQAVTQKFSTEFGRMLIFSSPTPFTSYGDLCPSGYNTLCTCYGSNCFNSEAAIDEDDGYMHHKNLYNIFNYTPLSNTINRLTFIGHKVCYAGWSHATESAGVYGAGNKSKKLAQVHDRRSLQDEKATVVHEIGHLFEAPDHYGGAANGWTIDQLNAYDGNPTRNLFDNYCIYGDGAYTNPNVMNSIHVCEGCTKVIRGEIDLPDSPPLN